MHKIDRSTLFLAAIIYCICGLLMPIGGLDYDTMGSYQWSAYIFEHGLGRAYESSANYLPGHLYQMKLYTMFCHSKEEVINNIHYLKYGTFIFDVIGALLVCSFVASAREQKMILLVLLLNPAYLHNTMAWGQYDSVYSCLAFASFLALYNRKYLLGAILYLISFNFKLQAIILLPPLFLFAVYQSGFKINWKKLMVGVLVLVLIEVIIMLPFIMTSEAIRVLETIKGLSGDYTYISQKSGNCWQLFLKGDLRWTSDVNTFKDIPFKTWGLILYSSSLLIVLFPFIRGVYLKWMQRSASLSLPKVLLVFALSALVFFYFNTQMHTRYCYLAFLFTATFAVITQQWWAYLLFSTAYFLNNDFILRAITKINYDASIFDLRFISLLYLSLICAFLFLIYRREKDILISI